MLLRLYSVWNYTVGHKKRAIWLLSISSPIIGRFSQFFRWHTLRTVCNNVIIIYPILAFFVATVYNWFRVAFGLWGRTKALSPFLDETADIVQLMIDDSFHVDIACGNVSSMSIEWPTVLIFVMVSFSFSFSLTSVMTWRIGYYICTADSRSCTLMLA